MKSGGGREADEIPAGLGSPVLQACSRPCSRERTVVELPRGAAELRQLRGQGQEVRALAPHRHQRLPPRDVTPQENLVDSTT